MNENILFALVFVVVLAFLGGVLTAGRHHRARRRAR